MKNSNLIKLSFVVVFAFIIQSCNDIVTPDPLTPVSISGTVTGIFNQNISGVEVAANGNFLTTGPDGKFNFQTIYPPYDMILTQGTHKYQIHDIEPTDIRLSFFTNIYDNLTADVSATFPAELFKPGVEGKVMFTDGNYINSYSPAYVAGGPFKVYFPDAQRITGKFIAIFYKKDAAGNIISYENYGESPELQINPGDNLSYNFSMSELSLDPGESNVVGQFVIPPGYLNVKGFYYLTFSTKLTKTYLAPTEFSSVAGNNFNIITPTGLPRPFVIMIGNTISNGANSISTESFALTSSGQTGITLESKDPPVLISPEDGATLGINDNITFSAGGGNGVYLVHISNITKNKQYTFITQNTSLNPAREISNIPEYEASEYTWTVEKVGPATNVNTYLTEYTQSPGSYQTNSPVRTFSTP